MSSIIETELNELLIDVTRLEIVDHSGDRCDNCHGSGRIHIEGQLTSFECPNCHGTGVTDRREVVFWDNRKKLELSLQDDNRTLKIFVTKREAK